MSPLTRLFRALRSKPSAKRRPTYRSLALESLEDRRVCAAVWDNVTFQVNGPTQLKPGDTIDVSFTIHNLRDDKSIGISDYQWTLLYSRDNILDGTKDAMGSLGLSGGLGDIHRTATMRVPAADSTFWTSWKNDPGVIANRFFVGVSIQATGDRTRRQASEAQAIFVQAVTPVTPPVKPDIKVTSLTADGTTLNLGYEISGALPTDDVTVRLVRSTNTTYDAADVKLDEFRLRGDLLKAGRHTATINIGSGLGKVGLPGAGKEDVAADYYILAIADPANAIVEADADIHHEDNVATLTGVYKGDNGRLFVHGTGGGDAVKIAANDSTKSANDFTLDFAGKSRLYLNGAVHAVDVRLHDGADSFEFTAGAGLDKKLSVSVWGGSEKDSARVSGNKGTDVGYLRDDESKLEGFNYGVVLYGFQDTRFFGSGGTSDIVTFEDGTFHEVFKATPRFASQSNSLKYWYAEDFDLVVARAVNGQSEDRAELMDSAGDDTLTFRNGTALLSGSGYAVKLEGYTKITVRATAGGKNDVAYIYDTPGNDTVLGTPKFLTLTSKDLAIRTEGFDRNYAYSTGGKDTARLEDSSGDDTFIATPTNAHLEGRGFRNVLHSFDEVTAVAKAGGNDSAILRDSADRDTFTADPKAAQMIGVGFNNRAEGFDKVRGESTPGVRDIAVLTGSAGRDLLRGGPTYAEMSGSGYSIYAKSFYNVEVKGGGDYDTANLFDSNGDDRLLISPSNLLLGNATNLIKIREFEFARVVAKSGGVNKAVVADPSLIFYQVVKEGDWV